MIDTLLTDIKRCIWYLNDICIHSGNTEVEHQATIKKELQQGVKHVVVGNLLLSKFQFHESMFLLHIINGQEVKIYLSKLENISTCAVAIENKKVSLFLVFTDFYCQFLVTYNAKAHPLIN